MLVAQKRIDVHKTLWDIEKGLQKKEVVAKNGVPKNTIYTWVKNRDKILLSLEKGQNVKRQKLRPRAHEVSDAAVFEQFLNMRSQNVPLSGPIIQEKASIYVKEFNIETSDGWLHSWKERRNIKFKTISGE